MRTITEPPLEAVAIEQRHEKLEVRLFPIVWCRRHKKEVTSQSRKQLAEPVAFCVLDFAAEKSSRHLVRFIANDEIPATVWSFEFFLNVFIAGELIEPGNNKVVLGKPVARTSGFEFVIGQNVEGELEALIELVLPLLSETTGANH